MHEIGIALQIIDIVKSSIPPDMPDARVRTVHLHIGKLSAVVTESLRFCFGVAAREEAALAGAALAIQEIPVVARCRDCHHQWTIEGPVFTCATCGSGHIDLVSGRELDVQSIEIESEECNDAKPSD